MSRSGYTEDCDNDGSLAMWRGVVASATRGKRGQRFFHDLVAALDALPIKRLVANELETEEGEVCALGALGKVKGVDMQDDDLTYDYPRLGAAFNIAEQLAQEVMFQNDEAAPWRPHHQTETPEERWTRVRKWAAEQIRP
jgi:hypothetical protein